MGSGFWFKTIITRKKVKLENSKQSKASSAFNKPAGSKINIQSEKNNDNRSQVISKKNGALVKLGEDVAATRIQTVFRAYMARKTVRHMKGMIRFQKLAQAQSVKKQSNNTLNHLHSWSMVQTQIRERRQNMVTEGRLKQKRLENQLKLEAKLHDLEVEWNGGAETMEEILARIHQREAAAVKRERTLAYAFSHQWRANSNQNLGSNAFDLEKANWGWSWKERWIAARPWESRVPSQLISVEKGQAKLASKARKISNSTSTQKPDFKSTVVNGKAPVKTRRLSYPAAKKTTEQVSNTNVQEAAVKRRESVP
ncbi:protein IQ-DOMAIN 9-like [Amaranthus tricolor]|uniref:protein IQ-DOMAIN 9-like n=1 Tax=Amaranthus tricolor TaxID=29722 RepID=UPI00258DB280|nr:protein IQ-DOMAIN 9-like [Amaranthus tricolor]XP_057537798.1 protein IQ-DOMAIN 9-like [Amaranthus tricolor]XP_057537799.1 protein IQ-DOMAIN 9-like [Amaranthus tricolor]